MSRPIQEALLPGTDALPRASLEWKHYKGKQLVRFRHVDGITDRRLFDTPDEAHPFFLECYEQLKTQAKQKLREVKP